MIDAIIALIRASDDRAMARDGLMAAPFEFSEEQANYILDMRLVQLTRLSRQELEDELAGLRQTIAELEAILADEGRKLEVIKEELAEVREAFATPRLAMLTHDTGEMSTEDLIDDKELVVVMTGAGYVKTVDADAFRSRAARGQGCRRDPAAGGRPGQPPRLHDGPRLPAVLLQPGQGVPAAGPRDPRAGAHRQGPARS